MTMSGSKVEGYEVEGSDIDNVVVGQVLSMEKHPDSDHLVSLPSGRRRRSAACKSSPAPNNLNSPWTIVPVALVGATVINRNDHNGRKNQKGQAARA